MSHKPAPRRKSGTLHPRNLHQGRYDMPALAQACPELNRYLRLNPRGEQSIDFADEKAVICLNKALLAHCYGVQWQIPQGYLCPPIPGRADYIHYAADLLQRSMPDSKAQTVKGQQVLDIGTGANCIYPIIGSQSYAWRFVASDIVPAAIDNARAIVDANSCLRQTIKLRLQEDPRCIFKGVIKAGEHYALSLCNPPFHASLAEAQAGTRRKVSNLARSKGEAVPRGEAKKKLNFGGQKSELWCPGGEQSFLKRMATESRDFSSQVLWFTALVSKSENIKPLQKHLRALGVAELDVLDMAQGQKVSRVLAWSFIAAGDHKAWLQQHAQD